MTCRFRASIPALTGVALLLAVSALSRSAHAQTTFSNTTPITINASGAAAPFPSQIAVSGLSGTITEITVALFGFSHTFPDDVAILFAGPSNTNTVMLAGGPGSSVAAVNLNWVFSDSATEMLPITGALSSGTFLPGLNEYNDVLSAPAPAGPYATSFAGFTGADPNGIYSLYIQDFVTGDGGSLSGGWSITITTNAVASVPEPGTALLFGTVGVPVLGLVASRRRRRG